MRAAIAASGPAGKKRVEDSEKRLEMAREAFDHPPTSQEGLETDADSTKDSKEQVPHFVPMAKGREIDLDTRPELGEHPALGPGTPQGVDVTFDVDEEDASFHQQMDLDDGDGDGFEPDFTASCWTMNQTTT